jgi:hypothetical protein
MNIGGDNIAFIGDMDYERTKEVLEPSQRWLGVVPGYGQGGITIVADGVENNRNTSEWFRELGWKLRTLPASSLMQVLTAHNLVVPDSALQLLRIISTSKVELSAYESNSIFRQDIINNLTGVRKYYADMLDEVENRITNVCREHGINYVDDVRHAVQVKPKFAYV